MLAYLAVKVRHSTGTPAPAALPLPHARHLLYQHSAIMAAAAAWTRTILMFTQGDSLQGEMNS